MKQKRFIWNSISFQIDYINAFVKRFTHKSFNRIEAQTTNKVVKIVPFWEFGVLFCQPDTLLRQLLHPFSMSTFSWGWTNMISNNKKDVPTQMYILLGLVENLSKKILGLKVVGSNIFGQYKCNTMPLFSCCMQQ